MNRITALAATAALAAGTLALSAPAQAAPTTYKKAASYTVTAKINETVAIGKETTLKVKGRVTPKAAGQKVVLQQRVGNKKSWKATGAAKIKSNGTYVLKDKPSTPGSREYRVVKGASNGFAKGISKSLAVEVYSWEKLAYRTPGPNTNITTSGATIGTEYYAASISTSVAGTASSIEYTLGRKCTSMRSSYALNDSSATGASGAVTVSADGSVLATHSLTVGAIVADEVIDISDAFRLKLDLSSSATPAAYTSVATPEVLCTR